MKSETNETSKKSKDIFFSQLAELSSEMIEAYDKEFAMGALVLAARFIAEGPDRLKNTEEESGNYSEKSPKGPSILM